MWLDRVYKRVIYVEYHIEFLRQFLFDKVAYSHLILCNHAETSSSELFSGHLEGLGLFFHSLSRFLFLLDPVVLLNY